MVRRYYYCRSIERARAGSKLNASHESERGDIAIVNELQRKPSIEGKETDFIGPKGEL